MVKTGIVERDPDGERPLSARTIILFDLEIICRRLSGFPHLPAAQRTKRSAEIVIEETEADLRTIIHGIKTELRVK